MKNFNEKFKKLMEDMGGAAPGTTAAAGIGSNPGLNAVPGQSGPNVYTGDVRGMGLFKSAKKKNKPKNNPGFKSKFKVIRRTPPGL